MADTFVRGRLTSALENQNELTCAARIVFPAPLAPARKVGRPAPRLVSKRKEYRSVLAVGTIISYTGTLDGYLARTEEVT